MGMFDLGAMLGASGAVPGAGIENSSIASAGGGGGMFGGGSNQQLMQALGGIKGMAPVSPIMSGGVAGGGQQAPGANIAGLQSNPLLAAIMGMITRQGAPQVPGIGSLLRGGLMRV